MPSTKITAVFECEARGPMCESEAVREALAAELENIAELYVQDDDHDDESEYGITVLSTDVTP